MDLVASAKRSWLWSMPTATLRSMRLYCGYLLIARTPSFPASSISPTCSSSPVRNEPDQKIIVEAVLDWLCKNSNWLLIFDDVDPQLIRRYLSHPLICHGYILLTTCSRDLNQLVPSIEVNQFDDKQGPLFLLRRLGYLAPKAQLQDARAG